MRAFIEKSLGLLSMYKGLAFGLSSIWAFALVLTFFGVISYNSLALLASTVVLVGATVLSSCVCAWLFGVKAHVDSSIITGLILALIFSPTLELSGLLAMLLVGLIAGASKFIFVYKGRHIFNPVAIAAVIIGFTGLVSASWWVGTPPLVPIVLAVAAVSLYKTRRFGVAGLFLAVAVPILLVVFATYGQTLSESLWLLLSWPLIFFASIMLTEPLTLPPRKLQAYVEAALVGVLFAVPISFAGVEMTPALALVIGNVFAFLVSRKYGVELRFKEAKQLTPTSKELIFTPSRKVRFEPGQYMEIQVPHSNADLRGQRRSFSLTSAPGADTVSFGIKFYEPSSTFKKKLRGIEKGMRLHATQWAGDFVLPKNTQTPLLFAAGGIGITPFIGQLRSMLANDQKRDIVLLYSVANPDEIAYQEVLEASGIKVVLVTSQKVDALPKGWKHISAPFIDEKIIETLSTHVDGRHGFVSGPPMFVHSLRRLLKKHGATKVVTDYFTGY
jgi:ferredoxin-NADP reductase